MKLCKHYDHVFNSSYSYIGALPSPEDCPHCKVEKYDALKEEKFKVRAGRGAIQDTEIRAIGAGVVLGEIPGVIALVGCTNYPNGGQDVIDIAKEFARRRFIVLTTGCAAMSIGMHKDEEGKTLYETNPSAFEAGSIINLGYTPFNKFIFINTSFNLKIFTKTLTSRADIFLNFFIFSINQNLICTKCTSYKCTVCSYSFITRNSVTNS